MFRALQTLLLVLTVWSVGHAQVFGLSSGFVCTDSGVTREIKAEHCHRDGATQEFTPCEKQSSPECEDKETSHHTAFKTDFESSNAGQSAPVAPPVFVALLMAEIPVFDWARILEMAHSGNSLNRPAPTDSDGFFARAAVQVAKCMVLLV